MRKPTQPQSRFRSAVARTGLLLAALAGLGATYALIARPWLLGWGATAEETVARLPGDGLVPAAKSQETRAITIDAPASTVWAWVSQIGQDRGGFYSFQTLENLFGCEMPNVEQLVPRLQQWKVGDKLWMYPPRKAGGAGFATLALLEPGRALGFATRQMGRTLDDAPDASWSFIVLPLDATRSRLVFRGRGSGGLRLLPGIFTLAIFEPVHFAMERRTMTNVKRLAEGRLPSRRTDTAQVILWTAVFLAFLAAAVAVLGSRQVAGPLAALVTLGLLFQVVTLGQPHPAVGAILLAAILATVAAQRKALQGSRRRAG